MLQNSVLPLATKHKNLNVNNWKKNPAKGKINILSPHLFGLHFQDCRSHVCCPAPLGCCRCTPLGGPGRPSPNASRSDTHISPRSPPSPNTGCRRCAAALRLTGHDTHGEIRNDPSAPSVGPSLLFPTETPARLPPWSGMPSPSSSSFNDWKESQAQLLINFPGYIHGTAHPLGSVAAKNRILSGLLLPPLENLWRALNDRGRAWAVLSFFFFFWRIS